MDFILCKKLDLFRYNKSTLNSMEKNILPTGKESTTPDTALLHPTLSDLLLSILVEKQGFFDTHSPVIFGLQVPSQQICRKTFRYPSTWISLPGGQDDIERALPFTIGKNGIPTTLEEWGTFSEDLVENALQGNTSPMDGMGYASAHISNANLCCLFDPCLVFPAGDMNKISSKVRLYPPINLHTVDGKNPLKTFEKMVSRISSINSSCREISPFAYWRVFWDVSQTQPMANPPIFADYRFAWKTKA